MVGWDISRTHAVISSAESARLAALGPLGEFCTSIQAGVARFRAEVAHLDGYDLPDPITMAIALDPSVATEVVDRHVRVETTGTLTRGQTVVDELGVLADAANTRVVRAASREGFWQMLTRALSD